MANRQVYPASLYPLRGDISAEAGAVAVRVQGIQNIPITTALPTAGQTLVYDAVNNILFWGTVSGILINGFPSSSTKQVFINGVADGATVFAVNINGVSDGG